MLHNITWSGYGLTLLIVLVAYYAILAFKYYKAEIRNILSGSHNKLQKATTGNKTFSKKYENRDDTKDQLNGQNLFQIANQFVDEIKHSLEQAALNNLIKEEVLYSLQQVAKKYHQLADSRFQPFIANYILIESSNYSSIHLSEEDLNTLWVG